MLRGKLMINGIEEDVIIVADMYAPSGKKHLIVSYEDYLKYRKETGLEEVRFSGPYYWDIADAKPKDVE